MSESIPPVIALLADLIRINSVNPNYEGGVPESAMADFVEKYFGQLQVEVSRVDVLPQRPNVLVTLPGRDRRRRIVLEAHMDTVSVSGMEIPPWEPEIRDGKMYGRGACDTKGPMAAMMMAITDLAREDFVPAVDVVFAAVIDEEYSYRGVAKLCEDFTAEAAIVAEPTDLKAVTASKGLVRWKIETHGKAAHSAKPDLGTNAIEHMSKVVDALSADRRRLATKTHPLLGTATCNVGVIRGGVQVNLVPAFCEIEIDRRILPGETPDSVLAEYQQLMDQLAAKTPGMQITMQPPMLTDLPLETSPDTQAVQVLTQVLSDDGLAAQPIGVPFCSDASKFGAIGIPSIIFGPGSIDQAHAAIEYISCKEVLMAERIYRRFIENFT